TFPDYSTVDLLAITEDFARRNEYVLTPEARSFVMLVFDGVKRGQGFGNARFARTLFEQALNAQALRLAGVDGEPARELEPTELRTLTDADFVQAARVLGEAPDRRSAEGWWRRSRAGGLP